MEATNNELAAFLRNMAEWVSARGVWTGAEIERFYIAAQRLESLSLLREDLSITEAEVEAAAWVISDNPLAPNLKLARDALEAARKART